MASARQESRRWRTWNPSANLRVLKWLAIVLPILFLALVDVLRHTAFSDQSYAFPGVFGLIFTYAAIVAAVVLFSHTIFAFIARLQRRVIDQNRHLTALNSVASATAEKLRLEDILSTGLDHVIEALNADAGLICLVDQEHEEHTAVCVRGFSPEVAHRIQRAKLRGDPVAAEVVRTGRPVLIERVFDDPGVAERARQENIKSGISAPLKSEGEVNGILAVATHQERHFSEVDQDFLDGIGGASRPGHTQRHPLRTVSASKPRTQRLARRRKSGYILL